MYKNAVMLNLFQHPYLIRTTPHKLPGFRNYVRDDSKVKGFTLIELLVVILIIGILSAVALPQYHRTVAKTRLVELVAQTNTLWRAQQLYFLENGTYTEDMDYLVPSLPAGCEKTTGSSYKCGRKQGGPRLACRGEQCVTSYKLLPLLGGFFAANGILSNYWK